MVKLEGGKIDRCVDSVSISDADIMNHTDSEDLVGRLLYFHLCRIGTLQYKGIQLSASVSMNVLITHLRGRLSRLINIKIGIFLDINFFATSID